MPGIFGIIMEKARSRQNLERDLRSMTDSMRHRPSYRQREYITDRLALGRIGPSFLNPEPQPIFNEDQSKCIVFDGELFDPEPAIRQLTKAGHSFSGQSDAEVVLHAFEEAEVEGISNLAGAYVGLIYNSIRNSCHLFTDRLGLRGCYYSVIGGDTFCFSSEFKAIVAISGFVGNVDVQAAAEFLNVGFPFFERTFFKEIKYLPYGSVLSFEEGRLKRYQYWDMPRIKMDPHSSFDDAVYEGSELLLQATQRQLRQSGRIGVMLSGVLLIDVV